MKSLQLAAIRIVRRSSQLGTAIAVIALMQFSIVLSTAVLPTVEAQSVEDTLKNLQSSERWISVNLGDTTQLGNSEISKNATTGLLRIQESSIRHSITYRPISDQFAGRYQLVGTDQLSDDFKITEGRLPTTCNEIECEVVVVNSQGLTKVPESFNVVGKGELATDTPLLSAIEPGIAVLIAPSASSVISLKNVAGYPASELWSIPVNQESLQQKGLSRYLGDINSVSSDLSLNSGKLLISGPTGILENTKSQVKILSLRILSLELTICLIASFIIFFIARASRESNKNYLAAVKRISPKAISTKYFYLILSLLSSVLGTSIGLIAASLVSVIFNKTFNLNAVDFRYLILNLITSFLVILIGLFNDKKILGIVTTLLTLSWAFFASKLGLDYWISIIALLTALFFYAVTYLTEKLNREKFSKNIYLSNRNQFLTLGLIVGMLVSLVVSATTYLNALNRNVLDNAIFQSPTQTRITMGGEAQPMQFNTFADYQSYAPGAEVYGVKKISTVFAQNAINSYPTQLVGVDSKVWKSVPEITHQTKFDLKSSDRVIPDFDANLGPSLVGAGSIKVNVAGLNEHTSLGIWVINERQESQLIELNQVELSYFAQLPIDVTNLLGFQITELPDYKSRRDHAVGEGINALPAPEGSLTITDVVIGNTPIELNQIKNIKYSVINGPVYLTLVQEIQDLPALIDSQTASQISDKQLRLKVSNEHSISLKEVGVVNQLPTVPMRFAVVNPEALTQYLASTTPELLRISEVWITDNLDASKLSNDSLNGLKVIDQKTLIDTNLTPSNAKWSTTALIFIVTLSGFLLILLSQFIVLNIAKDQQIRGWQASGQSIKYLRQKISIRIFIQALISTISATFISYIFIGEYIRQVAFDINGNVAYPPLVVDFKPISLLIIVVLFLMTTAVITRTATTNLKLRVSSDEN